MTKTNSMAASIGTLKIERGPENQESLQMILSMEETVILTEKVTKELSQGLFSSIQPSILSLSSNLKRHGPSLESNHGEHLDRLQLVLRSACRDKKLDLVSRLHLLEMIELRSFNWAPSEHVTNYYKMKLSQIKGEMLSGTKEISPAPTAQSNFKSPSVRLDANATDFHLGTSRLLMNLPSRPTTHRLFSSSLNPEPSPPFINLQEPPLRHRHRQSANCSGDNIGAKENYDKSKNKTKEEDINPESGDNNIHHAVTINTKDGDITLTSLSKELLRSIELILQEKLTDEILPNSSSSSSLTASKPELIYRRPELLEMATSPLCRLPPPHWDNIANEIPSIVKIKPIKT